MICQNKGDSTVTCYRLSCMVVAVVFFNQFLGAVRMAPVLPDVTKAEYLAR